MTYCDPFTPLPLIPRVPLTPSAATLLQPLSHTLPGGANFGRSLSGCLEVGFCHGLWLGNVWHVREAVWRHQYGSHHRGLIGREEKQNIHRTITSSRSISPHRPPAEWGPWSSTDTLIRQEDTPSLTSLIPSVITPHHHSLICVLFLYLRSETIMIIKLHNYFSLITNCILTITVN